MKAEGIKTERETVIVFNEEDADASIWTASDVVNRRLLKRLGRGHLTEEGERHVVFTFPKKWLVLPRFKAQKAPTPAQTASRARNAAKLIRISRSVSKKAP